MKTEMTNGAGPGLPTIEDSLLATASTLQDALNRIALTLGDVATSVGVTCSAECNAVQPSFGLDGRLKDALACAREIEQRCALIGQKVGTN